MYHRIAAPPHDPWRIAVAPDRFAEHIDVLTRTCRVVSLGTLVDALNRGELPRDWAAVTFDDGYADVLRSGLPILMRHGCPATLFLATGLLGGAHPFWWDELTTLLLGSETLPDELSAEVGGRAFMWVGLATARSGGRRLRCHNELWSVLRPLSAAARERAMERLRSWAERPGEGRTRSERSMTLDEVERLPSDLVRVGAHTVSHPTLPSLSVVEQRREIVESRSACEALVGYRVEHFAYPFGDYDEASPVIVREAGFTSACTTHGGMIRPRTDLFEIPRVHVADWTGEELERRLARDFVP